MLTEDFVTSVTARGPQIGPIPSSRVTPVHQEFLFLQEFSFLEENLPWKSSEPKERLWREPLVSPRRSSVGTPGDAHPECPTTFQRLPPRSRGTSRSKGGPGISTATSHTHFSTSNPLEQTTADSTKAGNDPWIIYISQKQGTIPGYFTFP